ncbi:MAG TPA: hypothetical protein DGG95_05375 [Cytophagales bacterium]|jgi:hypothetical protein|nr:hypothetical protein [Cytophagales bacterium]
MDKKTLDIKDVGEEFKKLDARFSLLQKRFIAVGLDYSHYIDNSWGEKNVYKLRDEVLYRLFCTRFHLELLLQHHLSIKHQIIEKFKKEPEFFKREYVGSNPLFEHYQKEISAIFDSTIFHMTSSFDYIATLCNYICGQNKEQKYKWSQLSNAARDNKNVFSSTQIKDVIITIDKEFVSKLYRHRSDVIHYTSDQNLYSFLMTIKQTEITFTVRFILGKNIVREFSDLRTLNKENNITVIYGVFWAVNKTLDKITDILFSLKNHMESFPKINRGSVFDYDKDTNTIKPTSSTYWEIEEYKK